MLPSFCGTLWDLLGSEHSSALEGFCKSRLRRPDQCPTTELGSWLRWTPF